MEYWEEAAAPAYDFAPEPEEPVEEPDEGLASTMATSNATSGTTGDCTWSYNAATQTLTISGSGDMGDMYYYENFSDYTWSGDLKSVVIGDGVTSIGRYAFYYCDALTNVIIGDNVTSIGYSAFESCTALTSITIPDSVTSIEDYAFSYCTALTSITIPDSVTSIGDYAFESCEALTSITIPDSVTSIEDYAFYRCEALTSITIPDSVISIGSYAFCYCTALTSVTIPDSVTSIGSYAFYNCTALANITIPDSVTSIEDYAFYLCTALTSITIPDSVTSIGSYAFGYCTALTSVTIPDSVTSIGFSAFRSCAALTSITIPDSVTNIWDGAFRYCTALTDVYYIGTEVQWNAISIGTYNTCLTDATIHYLGTADELISATFPTSTSTNADGNTVIFTSYFYDLETTKKLTVTDFTYTNGDLHVALNGYYTIDIPNYALPDSGMMQFPLVPTSTGTNVAAVLCNGTDALSQEREIYTNEESFTVAVYGEGTNYALKQDGSTLASNDSGVFTINPAQVTADKPLSVQIDNHTALETKIVVKSIEADIFTEFSLGKKVKFDIPGDVPFIGGGEIELDFNSLPVYFETTGNTIRLGIGVAQDLLKNETEWCNFKKFVESNGQSISSGVNQLLASKFGTATVGPVGDVDMEVYGFLEGEFSQAGGLTKLTGNLMIKIKAKVSQEWQTMVISVPVVIKMELSAEVEGKASVGWDFDNASICFGGSLEFVMPEVRLSGGVGVAKIGDVSVYGKASNKIGIDFDIDVTTGTLEGEAGVCAKVLFWKTDVPLLSGSWQYYHSDASTQSVSSAFSTQSLTDGASYSIDRSNLSTQSDWLGDAQTYATMSAPTMNESTLLQSSVYANANPLLAETEDGTQVLVWTADIADRTDGNHTAIVYSVNSNGTWSAPAIIEDDGTADFYPTVTTLDNDVYVAWMDANATFDANVELADLSASCEITVAKLSDDSWTIQTLTNDNKLDAYPNLNTVDGTVYLVWTANSENDIFSMTDTNAIYLATTNNWDETVYTTVSSPITEVEVGQVGDDVVISYITIDDEISLYAGTIGSVPTKLAAGDLTGSSFEELNGASILFWNSQDSASYTTDLTTVIDLTVSDGTTLPEFIQILDIGGDTYLVGAIGTDENGMYSYQLDGTTVGNGVLMLDLSDRYLTSMSAVQGDNGLDVVYLSTKVTITEGSVEETPDIYITSLTPYADAAIVGGYYEGSTDTGVPVALTLENTGLTTITAVTITATQGDSTVASSDETIELAPGAQQAITIEIPHTARDGSDIDYTFTATISDDVDATNDSLDLTVGLVDVSVETTLLSGGEAISATVAVANEGDLDTIVMLNVYKDDVDSELLATYRCGEIATGTTEYFQLDNSLLSQYAYQGTTLCFAVESLDTEEILFNNVSYAYVSQGQAAMRAELGEVSTTGSQVQAKVTFTVNEVGCTLIAATYANGKLQDSATYTVTSQQTTQDVSLVKQNDTDELTIYLVDEDWEPLLEQLTAGVNS